MIDDAEYDNHVRAMCVFEEGSQISFACYAESSNILTLQESRAYGGPDTEDICESFMAAMRPNVVLVGQRLLQNKGMMELLTRDVGLQGGGVDGVESAQSIADPEGAAVTAAAKESLDNIAQIANPKTIPFKVLKSSSFDIKACRLVIIDKLKIKDLVAKENQKKNSAHVQDVFPQPQVEQQQFPPPQSRNPYAPAGYDDHSSQSSNNFNMLSGVINFTSSTLTKALGGLLSYLLETVFRLDPSGNIEVRSLKVIQSDLYMSIDLATMKSLHIFSEEKHPMLRAKGKGESKEGFSLYTLLNLCNSKIGKQKLREWMYRPLRVKEAIEKRQTGVELFMQGRCSGPKGILRSLLHKVGDVPAILSRMHKCQAKAMDYIVLKSSLTAAIKIFTIVRGDLRIIALDDPTHQDFVKGLLDQIAPEELAGCYDRISEVIDEELTIENNEVVINAGFSPELDMAKARLEDMDDMLTEVGKTMLNRYPSLIRLRVIFLPQIGFLIALDRESSQNVPEGFEFFFSEESDSFFKNDDMKQLDEEEGDLDALIKDTELLIASRMEDEILEVEAFILNSFEVISELDVLLSFATCASDYDWNRPSLLDDGAGTIFIENGRQPLQELISEHKYIPNDTMILEGNPINVITGPNYSGKSCYIRQVGILVYLAQIGCFIPCDKASISIADKIMARISLVESCSIPQSSFQMDLSQMATILRQCTSNTLVLVDEFGKGTAPASGMAVLAAALNKLGGVGCKVLCTTHFLELFSLGILEDGTNGVKAFRMSIHRPAGKDDIAIPLFKLELGVASSSDGLLCAKMAGIPKSIICRSEEILHAVKTGESIKPMSGKKGIDALKSEQAKAALVHFFTVDAGEDGEGKGWKRDPGIMKKEIVRMRELLCDWDV